MYSVDKDKMPKHIAFIMDGNGRWAKKRFMPRNLGHKAGVEALRGVITDCSNYGIEYITMYAFSTENWTRPEDEVQGLMKLLIYFFDKEIDELNKNNVIIDTIGDLSKFSPKVQETLENAKKMTKDNNGIRVILALNYGGRNEITRACKAIVEKAIAGDIKADEIDENMFASYLDTRDFPDPDLMVRTSGEIRLSNYMLWQCAYTEFYATDVYWPDFNTEELNKAINVYQNRERRFGKV